MPPQHGSERTYSREEILHHRSNSNNLPQLEKASDFIENDDSPKPKRKKSRLRIPPPTTSLPVLVFIDMFAVALVVPLLFQYYRRAGITSAKQRELLASVFSFSQIIGGLVLGALNDAKILSRKTILFLSFGGSAVAYAAMIYGGFKLLIFSRVLVGLVKQTMTISTSILTKCTTEKNRAKFMGRLESSATAAWIIGPSVGALLFKHFDHKAPALFASALFLVNIILAAILVHDKEDERIVEDEDNEDENKPTSNYNKKARTKSLWANLKSCFSSKKLGSVIAAILIHSWVTRATSFSTMGSYYEDMYGVEPHHRGYIQSYHRVLGFIVQSLLVGPILARMGGERMAICISSLLLSVATLCEIRQSLPLHILLLSPAISISMTMIHVSLRSLLTRVAPDNSIFSVFAALDVLKNATAVTVPFYRTFLFQLLGGSRGRSGPAMEGDPEPVAWVLTSGLHWIVASIAMILFLWPGRKAKQA